MIARLKGLKQYRVGGRLYVYHRASGTRLHAEPGTPEFLAELARLETGAGQEVEERSTAPEIRPGTLAALIQAYKASPDFQQLKPRTRRDYDRVFAWLVLGQGAGDVAAIDIDTPTLMEIRDQAFAEHKRKFANDVIAVLSRLYNWGKPRGLTRANPAEGAEKIRRPRELGPANRPWTPAELFAGLSRAKGPTKVAVALAAFAGLRRSDIVAYPRAFYDGRTIMQRQAKTGDWVRLPAYSLLRRILDKWVARLPPQADFLLTTRLGTPITAEGLASNVARLIETMERDGVAQPGLTLHGLRTTFGTSLKELDLSDAHVAKLLGHADERSTRTYTRHALMTRHAKTGMAALERSGYGKLSKTR